MQSSFSSFKCDGGKPSSRKKDGSGGVSGTGRVVTCYTCGEEGHYSPDCPNSKTAASKASPGKDDSNEKDSKKLWGGGESWLVCYKCSGKGHKWLDCPSDKTYQAGKDARKAHAASRAPRASSPLADVKKSPAPKNQLDTQPVSDLGTPWAPYYALSAVPKSALRQSYSEVRQPSPTPPPTLQPPVLVPSNLVWDKIKKEYVDTSSYYYYETRQPSVFNNFDMSVPTSFDARSSPELSSHSDPIALMKALASTPSVSHGEDTAKEKAAGPMHTVTETFDGQKMLTVLDSGTHVCVVPQSVISACNCRVHRQSDVVLTSADDMFTDPVGVCDDFQFKLGNTVYTTKIYIIRKASFQLLLGNKFLWKVGISLFPQLSAIMISYLEFQVLKGSCERITPDKAPPLLTPVVSPRPHASVTTSSTSAAPAQSSNVDPLSGLPFESPQKNAHFLYFDVRKPSVPFLKVSVSPSVITISERDYLNDAELDNDPTETLPTSVSRDCLSPMLTDTCIRSRIDINPLAPTWFKDAMVGIILKYHQAISWTDYDLGCVTHYPHEIRLLPNSVGVRQPSRQHLYSQRYADIIETKTRPFVNMGIWIPCLFSD